MDAKSFATGGHDHDSLFYPRPLGILSINGNEIDNSSYTTIPLDGIIVLFAASAVAGEISLQTSAIGLDENPISVAETIFRVKEPGLVALVDTYPIGIGAVSHPSVGGHGSPILHEKLKKAGKYYLDSFNASDIPEREFRTINSGGASLPWGGLFDINQNWNQPHCSHRQGNEIDFGLSSFNPRWEYQPPKEIEFEENEKTLGRSIRQCWI